MSTQPKLFTRFAEYMRGTKGELKKISWVSRQDAVRYSILVAVITILTATSFAGLDYLFSSGLKMLIN